MYNFESIIAHFVEHAPEWSIAISMGVLFFIFLWVFFKVLSSKLRHSSSGLLQFAGTVFGRFNIAFLIVASIYFTISLSPTPDKFASYAKTIFMVAVWIQLTSIILTLIKLWLEGKRQSELSGENLTMYNAIGLFLKLTAIIIAVLLILQALGFNVSTFVAGLGIGGIAIALAAQNILGDLFASISILIAKPFIVGDNIVAGDVKGVVEEIGLKTTSLRAESGEQIICPNGVFLKSTIHNFKRIENKVVILKIGVVYEISQKQMEAIPTIMKSVVNGVENCKFERAHFITFGESALIYELSYIVQSTDLILYLDTQQKVNFELKKKLTEEQISFAYPTQTVHQHN